MKEDRISMIVPMHNASGHIEECLSAISRQTAKDLEVILVDDHSTDDTVEKARKYPFGKIISPEERGRPAGARNRGAKDASGDILVFVDSDIVLEPDSIEKITSLLSEPDTDVVSGTYKEGIPQTDFFSQLQNLMPIYRQSKLPEFVTFTNSAFCAMKRSVFESVGGYSEAMPYYEDVEIGHRLTRKGYRCRSNPGLKVTHLKQFSHSSMLRDYFKKVAVAGAYKRDNSAGRPGGEELPVSLKIAGLSSGMVLLSAGLIGVTPAPFLLFLGVYSVSIAPMLLFLIRERGLFFGLRSYVVCFEISVVSFFAMAYGILTRGRNE